MGNINSVIIEGNLTKAAELSRWGNGTPYCRFTIAHNQSYKDDAGNWVDIPSFFDCVITGNYAESMHKHLLKGRWVLIEAHLKQNRWKDNTGVNHYAVSLVVDNLRFAPGSFQAKEQGADAGYSGASNYQQSAPAAEENYSSQDFNIPDEIPF
jgi:single-strand DNA-binding protein